MKKAIQITLIVMALSLLAPVTGKAQSVADLLQQLALDYQKLAGMKSILSQLYKGYEILTKGYNSVKDVSQGNFTLHQVFLDGLMVASPAVRKYPRVADVMNDQVTLISEYKTAWSVFSRDPHFSPDELNFMLRVYNHLVNEGLKNISDLSFVLTDNKTRMSDAERLAAIDRIYMNSHNQVSYLRKFNDEAYQTAVQRAVAADDRQSLKTLYGLN
jgi:hypothetical protein